MILLKYTCTLQSYTNLPKLKPKNLTTTNPYKTNTKNKHYHEDCKFCYDPKPHKKHKINQNKTVPSKPTYTKHGEDTESTATCSKEAQKPCNPYAIQKHDEVTQNTRISTI
jgi:hypothetical protein